MVPFVILLHFFPLLNFLSSWKTRHKILHTHEMLNDIAGYFYCGFSLQMFSSILFAAIGFAGAAYNFIISAVALNKGPICYLGQPADAESDGWGYDTNAGYVYKYIKIILQKRI